LFAYGSADATASQNPIISTHLNPDWFYLSGTTQVVLEKRPLNGCSSNALNGKSVALISCKLFKKNNFSYKFQFVVGFLAALYTCFFTEQKHIQLHKVS